MSRVQDEFQTIHSEGGLLPPDLLRRLGDPKGDVPGTKPEDYGLPRGDRINDAITQSWNVLRRHWTQFRSDAQQLPASDAGTGLTNDKWTLPLLRELGFGLLQTGAGPEAGGRTYAISRMFGSTPVHLVGCGLSLDRRTAGARGAAVLNPHGLVQEFLNRKTGSLWGIVSNGLQLRILRDSQALSRQSYLEFDLETMFNGEIYPDYVVLWLTAHATRFQEREAGKPDTCWLEEWTKVAAKDGTRILGDLRQGVEKALETLGQGFVGHPQNGELRDALRGGTLSLQDFHAQLLRVVYRLIFLFVAEDRVVEGAPLLHPRDDSPEAQEGRERYAKYYGTKRLRRMAGDIRGSRHGDLWQQFNLLVGALSGDERFEAARRHLSLPAFGSFLWSPANTSAITNCALSNADLLEAVRQLAFTRQDRSLRPVDYRNLGAEELGGVYEGLLALTPQVGPDGKTFSFAELAGNERKTSGSYYTPDSLVQCLLDSALDPVVEEAIQGKSGFEAERAILGLKVCDPAVGSGHFLVGAAHRLARHLARVRAVAHGESEPSPLLYQHALRDVIRRCLYGVDLNPMAAELCRVSLWLEALEPGKPLFFLDHHIRVGNSLIGASPELITAGVLNVAFTPIGGDDKRACAVLKRRNSAERKGLGPLFAQQAAEMQEGLRQAAEELEALPDDQPEDVRAKELTFRRHEETNEYRRKTQLADAWCAAFVIKKQIREPGREASVVGITQADLNALVAGHDLPAGLYKEVQRLADQYQFFHWHLTFPEVFARGGFDCVLGNPPWERVQFEERTFFAYRRPEIFSESSQSRRRALVARLANDDPELYAVWEETRRQAEAEAHFLRRSGRYPLSTDDKFNLYAVFLELSSRLYRRLGRVGIIVKAGFISDSICAPLFSSLMERKKVARVLEFENKAKLFADVHPQERFALVALSDGMDAADFCFDNREVGDALDPNRHVWISFEDVCRFSPNTASCPKFASKHEYALARRCYAAFPPFKRHTPAESPWGVSIDRYINVSDFSDDIRMASDLSGTPEPGPEYLGLYEGKLFHQFDHRFATYVQTGSESTSVEITDKAPTVAVSFGRYIPKSIAIRRNVRLENLPAFVAVRDITNRTNERGVIAAVIPACITDYTVRVVQLSPSTSERQLMLTAVLNSFMLDYLARQRIGGTHLNNDVLEQLPTPSFDRIVRERDWVLPRSLELTYTSWDLQKFAEDYGWKGPPFCWNEERRFVLRCELDAAVCRAYLPTERNGEWSPRDGETSEELAELKASFQTPRDAFAYIMDTFPIVRRRDEESFGGDYRTKRVILEIYDAMTGSIQTGQPYRTRLDPPPADPSCCQPLRERARH